MRFSFISILVLLISTQITNAQWQRVEQDAYNNKLLKVNSSFLQNSDTLFTVSYGDLYYSTDFGKSYDFYPEFIGIDRAYVTNGKIYVSSERDLYSVADGIFTIIFRKWKY